MKTRTHVDHDDGQRRLALLIDADNAKSVLDARTQFPDATLADLYDPLGMPPRWPTLRWTRRWAPPYLAAEKAAGRKPPKLGTDAERVAFLLERCQALTSLLPVAKAEVRAQAAGAGMRASPAWMLSAALLLSACADRPAPATAESGPRPQQAGQPLDPLATAARMAAIRGAAVLGNQDAARQQMDAMSHDLQRAMRLPDPARRIPAEPARQLAAAVAGVSSVAWVDPANLLAMVDGAQYRDHATIDRICVALEPLGDTLWVTVHLQDRQARGGEGLDILSRNCQLPPGENAFGQRQRRMNMVEPAVRTAHRATTAKMRDAQARKSEDDRANGEALRNIPEM